MMKVVALIPYWKQYKYENNQIVERDTMRLGGRVLLNFPIELSNKVAAIHETYLFTNDQQVASLVDNRLRVKVLPRDAKLDSQQSTVEAIISDFLNRVDADVIVLLHPKSPFVKKRSLEECIERVTSGEHDSAFLARIEPKFAWYRGKRINYDVASGTPHLSLLEPIVLETSSLYVFTRECFLKFKTRIGNNAFIRSVGAFEGMVIGSPEDAKVAEFLLDSQFDVEG